MAGIEDSARPEIRVIRAENPGGVLSIRSLRAILEAFDDAIIGISLDGIVESSNPAVERIFGYRQDEIVGQPLSVLLPPFRSDEEKAILAMVHRGERISDYETEFVGKDSTAVLVSLSVLPILDPSDALVGAVALVRDVTERKLALDPRSHLSAIVDSATDAIIGLTLDGFILTWNRAAERIFGVTEADVRGRSISNVVPARHPTNCPRSSLASRAASAWTTSMHPSGSPMARRSMSRWLPLPSRIKGARSSGFR